MTSAIHRAAGAIISAPSAAIPIESSGADTGAGAGACEKNMLSTNERSSPRSASVWASRVSGEGSTAGCCGALPSRASLTSHKLMELRTPVRCLRTRGQLDELPPPLLSPSQSTLMLPSDSASAALSTAVECARPHVRGATGSLRTVGASTCSLAAMAVCSSQMVGASRLRVKAFFPLRFGGAVSAYARRARGTMGDPALAPAIAGSGPATPMVDLCPPGRNLSLPRCRFAASLGISRGRAKADIKLSFFEGWSFGCSRSGAGPATCRAPRPGALCSALGASREPFRGPKETDTPVEWAGRRASAKST